MQQIQHSYSANAVFEVGSRRRAI